MPTPTFTITAEWTNGQLQFVQSNNLPIEGCAYLAVPRDPIIEIQNGVTKVHFAFVNAIGGGDLVFEPLGLQLWSDDQTTTTWVTLTQSGNSGPFDWSTEVQGNNTGFIYVLNVDPSQAGVWKCWLAAKVTYQGTAQTIILDPKIYNEGQT